MSRPLPLATILRTTKFSAPEGIFQSGSAGLGIERQSAGPSSGERGMPAEMLVRKPELRQYMVQMPGGLGMKGGPENPLGARAMYLYSGNKDTLYRIHGTNEPWTIGTNVSSGCIRLTTRTSSISTTARQSARKSSCSGPATRSPLGNRAAAVARAAAAMRRLVAILLESAQSYYESGMKLLSDHSNEKAAVEFRNAVKLKRDLLPAWRGLAQAEEATRHWEGLVPALRTILELDPNDEATRFKLARLLLIGGAVDQSLKLVSEASVLDTKNANLLALKAIIFNKLKDNDAAIREAHAALKIEPENVDALIVLVANRLANNDPKGALQLLSSGSLAQKKDLAVQLLKIKIYEQLKDYQQLKSLFISITDPHGKDVAFRYQLELAQFDYDQGKFDDSFRLLEMLGGTVSPAQAVMVKIMLAELNLRLQNTDVAEKIVDSVLTINERNVDALKLRASIRLNQGEFDAAISDLQEALKGQPFSANLVLMLAIAYERSGSIELADKQFAYVTRASNFNADVGLSYAAFLRRHGRIDRASDVLTQLANRWPNNIQVLATLAELKLSRQDWAGAQEIAQTIKRI